MYDKLLAGYSEKLTKLNIQDTGLQRNTIDKFYTKQDTVSLCMVEFKN